MVAVVSSVCHHSPDHGRVRLGLSAQYCADHYGNGVASLQGTGSDEEGPSGPLKRGRLDLRLENSERHSRSSPDSVALEAFRRQMAIAQASPFLFPSDRNGSGHQATFKTVWSKTLRRAKVPYFRIYDLRSTYATRLSAVGVADEWVTQMLRQGDAQVFTKYSQMKLQMKCEALEKLNRRAGEIAPVTAEGMCTVTVQ